jgi:hypothetical protein
LVEITGSYGPIGIFCVAGDGNVYASGDFTNESGKSIIVSYNQTKHIWEEVKSKSSGQKDVNHTALMGMATDSRNNLYVHGELIDSAGNRYIAKWDGTSWSEFGVTKSKIGWTVRIDRNDNFYAIGGADYPGDCVVKKWNGTSWVSVGVPLDAGIFPFGGQLAIDAAGNVYSDALSDESGVGKYIVKYTAIASQAPKLFSFTPTSGSVGTTVTIKGQHLTGTASVSFGGTRAASFAVQNDSIVTAVVAKGSTGSVLVITTGGADSLLTFTYTCDSVKGPVPYLSLYQDSILVSSNANYYQWYHNNHQLENQHSNSLHVKGAGFYHVETSEDKFCWVSSLDYPLLISRNALSDSLKLSIYPNPSGGQFTAYVKLPQTTTVKTYVQVFDVNGVQVLQTSRLIFYGNEIRIPVTINRKGTFFVKIFVNDDAVQQSVIIM